jgi:flagellar hook-associated protein 1 FlgK
MVSTLGVEARTAIRRDSIQGTVLAAAEATANSVGSVSLDEEMASLVATQRAYEANARVLNVVNDLMGTIINIGR